MTAQPRVRLQAVIEVSAASAPAAWSLLQRAVQDTAATAARRASVVLESAALGPAPSGFEDVRGLFQKLGQGRSAGRPIGGGGGVEGGGPGRCLGGPGDVLPGGVGVLRSHDRAPVAVVEVKQPGQSAREREEKR
jgi:hypothetical protein